MADRYADLLAYIRSLRLVSTHNHHLNDEDYAGIGLRYVLEHSYVNWAERPPQFDDREAWRTYLLKNGTNSFFRWLLIALEKIYGLPVRPDTVEKLDEIVTEAYKDPEHHLRLMTEHCRFDTVINERQPHPGDDLGHPTLFRPSFRCDCFFSGWLADKPEPNGFFARSLFGREVTTMCEYLGEMRAAIAAKKAGGCIALKVAIAYERPIEFRNTDLALAEKALNNPNASDADVIAFGDVVMHELAAIAADLGLPLQIHTGSGQYEKTNPIGLLSLIQSHPQTKFHLLHGGFPWVDDTYALLLAAPNVYSDTCWIPYLSTHTAKNYLITALEVADTHRLTWGCDTWMPEDSVGALLAMEHTLARALADMIADGAATFSYACYIAKRILADNAKELFGGGRDESPKPQTKPSEGLRLQQPGAYFVTICTQDRAQTLGGIPADKVVGDGFPVPQLSPIGQIAKRCAQQISQKYPAVSVDSFVVMPNHIHLLLSFVQPDGTGNPSPTLGKVIGWYKYTVTVQANALLGTTGKRQLQRSFHDRVVRDEAEYAKLWTYVETNPARWREDCFYTEIG